MVFLRYTLVFLFLLVSTRSLYPQSGEFNESKLERAVRLYNSVSSAITDLKGKEVKSESDRVPLDQQIEQALDLLDEISVADYEDLGKAKKYFRTNLIYKKGYLYGFYGNLGRMMEYILPLKDYMDEAGPSLFPIRYRFDEKNYIIKYDDFKYQRGEFYSLLCEGANSQKLYDQLVIYARAGLKITEQPFQKLLIHDFLIRAKINLGQYDEEMSEQSLGFIATYLTMDSDNKAYLDSLKYTHVRGWNYLKDLYDKNPLPGNEGAAFARAATMLVQAGDQELARQAYERAMDKNYSDRSFLFAVLDAGDFSSRTTKVKAINQLAAMNGHSCYDLGRIAGYYRVLGFSEQAGRFDDKSRKCSAQVDRQVRKAGGGGMHLYLGTYPLRFIAHKDYIDYGGVLGITAGKFMLHASYMHVQRNMYAWTDMFFREVDDNSSEKYRWSGQQIDLTFRFSSDDFDEGESVSYIGPQFGYSTRKLMPITSSVTDPLTGVTVPDVRLEPLDTHYQLAVNMGQYVSSKAFAMDFNYSIGASYARFSMDHPTYTLADYTYGHSYLDARNEWHWGLVLRVGFTLGLSL